MVRDLISKAQVWFPAATPMSNCSQPPISSVPRDLTQAPTHTAHTHTDTPLKIINFFKIKTQTRWLYGTIPKVDLWLTHTHTHKG